MNLDLDQLLAENDDPDAGAQDDAVAGFEEEEDDTKDKDGDDAE